VPPGRETAPAGSAKKEVKRRPPRTVAVNIKSLQEGFSYAEALKTLRDKIALADLEINSSKIRKVVGGGLIIEISGEDKVDKAEKLKNKISDLYLGIRPK